MQQKYPNMTAVNSKMELTFSLGRKEIVREEPLVKDVLQHWPALFLPEQVRVSQIGALQFLFRF